MTPCELKNKVLVEGAETNIIGQFFWFTIPSLIRIGYDRLDEILKRHGLPEYMLPHIRPSDAFRRATSRAEKKHIPYGENFMNIMVREVLSDKERVVRHVVREIVDKENVCLDYSMQAEIEFRRDTGTLFTNVYGGSEIQEIVDEAKATYQELRQFFEDDHVRRMAHAVINSMKPTSLKSSGSVYFIPQEYAGKLEKLEGVFKELGVESFSISMIDEPKAVDMVKERLIFQTNRALNDFTEALKDKNALDSKRVQMMVQDAAVLLEQVRAYEDVLKQDLSSMQTKIQIIQGQVMGLLDAA